MLLVASLLAFLYLEELGSALTKTTGRVRIDLRFLAAVWLFRLS